MYLGKVGVCGANRQKHTYFKIKNQFSYIRRPYTPCDNTLMKNSTRLFEQSTSYMITRLANTPCTVSCIVERGSTQEVCKSSNHRKNVQVLDGASMIIIMFSGAWLPRCDIFFSTCIHKCTTGFIYSVTKLPNWLHSRTNG